MRHYTDDELVLHYYGESDDTAAVTQHLDACATCADAYRAIHEALHAVPVLATPERDAFYGQRVWGRVSERLSERRSVWALRPFAIGAAAATILIAAFVAGRTWPQKELGTPTPAAAGRSYDAQDRARVAATSDHLDRSERVLLDVLNAGGDEVDLSAQQTWASDLIDSNRFYRDAASQAGDSLTAGVLDDLERSLLDVVHGPAVVTPEQLDDLRARVDAAALLFKVRILADELREREAAPPSSGQTL